MSVPIGRQTRRLLGCNESLVCGRGTQRTPLVWPRGNVVDVSFPLSPSLSHPLPFSTPSHDSHNPADECPPAPPYPTPATGSIPRQVLPFHSSPLKARWPRPFPPVIPSSPPPPPPMPHTPQGDFKQGSSRPPTPPGAAARSLSPLHVRGMRHSLTRFRGEDDESYARRVKEDEARRLHEEGK